METSATRGKKVLALIVFLIAALAAWETKQMWRGTPPAPVSVPVVENNPPVLPPKQEAPPLPVPPPPLKKAPTPPKKAVAIPKRVAPPPPVSKATRPVALPPPPIFVPPPAPPPPQEWQGTDTSVTHTGQIVIHNDRQWIHFWSEHHPHEAAPDVDFATNMVVGVFAGARPAEPFSIKVVAVQILPGALEIDYRERLPPTGTFAVNVTVYPYDIKVIPRSDLPVKFKLFAPENGNP